MRDRLIEAFRGLLALTPSPELFSTLCDELDGAPDPDPDVLAYLRGHLQRWPESVSRAVPARWATMIARGEPVAAAALCDTLVFTDDLAIDTLPEPCLGIRRLSVAYLDCGEITGLVRSAREVRELDVRYTGMDDARFAALVELPNLANLTSLHAQGNALTAASARALADAAHLGSLRVLDLRHNTLGEPGARALADAQVLASIEQMRLHREDIGGGGARALATSPTLPRAITSWWSAVVRRTERRAEWRGW